jgi:predicted dienelactone hydrolase
LVVAAAACSGAGDKRSADYASAGPHGVGEHAFTVVDTSRATPANGSYAGAPTRTLDVVVWYPSSMHIDGATAIDGPLDSGGPFPLVLHSHGFHDDNRGEDYLAQHLASRGYVVAAPKFPLSNGNAPGGPTLADTPNQPGDAKFVIDQVLAQSQMAGGPLTGAVDGKRIAVSGLSLGGLTTLLVAFHDKLRDPRVTSAFAIAAPSCFLTAPFYQTTRMPLMLLQGDADLIVPFQANSVRAFGFAQQPKQLVALARGSHTAFASLASVLDPTMNYDRIGCSAIQGATNVSSFAALGDASDGISSDTSICPAACAMPPMDPSLLADRQQALTKIIGAAFFDATIKGDAAAEKFLQTRLAPENAEVTSTLE